MNPVPMRGEDCPPRVRLEAHSAGEEPALAAHVTSCPHCGPYVSSLRSNSEAYVRARPPEMFLQQLDRRPPPAKARFWWPALLGAALSVGVVTLLLWPDPAPDSKIKGDSFQIFLKRGEADPTPVRMDQSVRPGDRLRFAYDAPVAGWLAVFELDGTEEVELRTSRELSAGTTILSGAAELDAAPGPEWFVAVFSAKPLDLEALSAQLKGQSRQPRLTLECGSCRIEAVRVVKEVP